MIRVRVAWIAILRSTVGSENMVCWNMPASIVWLPKAEFIHSVTPMPSSSASASTPSAPREQSNPFQGGRVSRITTIHPKTYDDAQMVGRAIRDGIPVVLNLTGVAEAVAYRIVDFSAGVVFGVRGSIERVTPRVFLLSPAQVNIKVEEPEDKGPAHDLFAD